MNAEGGVARVQNPLHSRHGAAIGFAAADVCADAQRARPGAFQQGDAGADKAGHVDIGPDSLLLGQVVALVQRAGKVEHGLEHAGLADDACVDVHGAVGPHQVAADCGVVEGLDLIRAWAAQLARVERAAVLHFPRDTVDVE
eukprot:5597783-Prymnesium_polylepis.2